MDVHLDLGVAGTVSRTKDSGVINKAQDANCLASRNATSGERQQVARYPLDNKRMDMELDETAISKEVKK